MSSYFQKAIHPQTKKIATALFLDDYYGHHRYGVKFPDGTIYPIEEIETCEEQL